MKKWMNPIMVTLLLAGTSVFPCVVAAEKGTASSFLDQKVISIAHRGASGHAPENTMVAYELAQQMNADFIEIDLQMTKDGTLIAMHDPKVNRTTNGTGFVKDMTLAEIKELDAGSWFNEVYPEKANQNYLGLKVPTLEEIFARFGHTANYYIETKAPDTYPGLEEKLLDLLETYSLIGTETDAIVLIQSFSQESLLKIKEKRAEIPLIQLLKKPDKLENQDAQLAEIKTYAIGIGPNYKNINNEYVQKVRAHGLFIHPYTVNDKANMRKLIKWGGTGVFSNFPDRLFDVRKELS